MSPPKTYCCTASVLGQATHVKAIAHRGPIELLASSCRSSFITGDWSNWGDTVPAAQNLLDNSSGSGLVIRLGAVAVEAPVVIDISNVVLAQLPAVFVAHACGTQERRADWQKGRLSLSQSTPPLGGLADIATSLSEITAVSVQICQSN